MRIFYILLLSPVALFALGCAPGFQTFSDLANTNDYVAQHRLQANGNALASGQIGVIDTLLYERRLNGGISAQVIGSPRFIVVPTLNERIYFIDPASGKPLTSLTAESAIGSAAALADQLLYYAEEAGGDRLVCFNLVNGKTVWGTKIVDASGAPIIDGEDLFITSRQGKVYRLNRWRGDIVWNYDTRAQCYASPAVDKQHVYLGTDKGEIICLDRATGEKVWSFKTGGTIFAQPMVDRYLFCGSADGTLYALDPASGSLKWSYTTLAAIHTTPVLAAGRLLIGSDDRTVYCLNSEDGGLLWQYETDAIVQSSPVATSESFICANSAGSLYQFSLDGKILSSFKVKGSISASPALIDDRLFVVTKRRMLYCFASMASLTSN